QAISLCAACPEPNLSPPDLFARRLRASERHRPGEGASPTFGERVLWRLGAAVDVSAAGRLAGRAAAARHRFLRTSGPTDGKPGSHLAIALFGSPSPASCRFTLTWYNSISELVFHRAAQWSATCCRSSCRRLPSGFGPRSARRPRPSFKAG